MSHASRRRPCSRTVCNRTLPLYLRPAQPPSRTPDRRMSVGRCGAVLRGHRTPGDVHLLAQQMAEVLVGRRAPEVLRSQVTVPVREELRRLRGTVSCELAPRLARVFHQRLSSLGVEASAVITCDRRSRVFAFRARWENGRWVCTRLETDTSGAG